MNIMYILVPGYLAMGLTQTMSGVMRGAGDTVTPMGISLFSAILVRTTLAYVLVELSKTPENPIGNPLMVYVSMVISWVTGALVNVYFYRRGNWRRLLPTKDEACHEAFE